MFSFYPSHPRALRYLPSVYSVYPDDDSYLPYLSSPDSRLLVTNPEVRYRRALGEYVAAEEEYNALLRAREAAKLRAHAEAIRQERARLRVAQLARARRELQARQFKQGLAKALARAAVSGNDDPSLHHVVPVTVMYQASERPLSDMFIPSCMDEHASCPDGAGVQKEKEKVRGVRFESCLHSILIMAQAQRDAKEETSVNQYPTSVSEPGECECSVPNLESVLRERLQKIAGDEEVQDLARAILRHLTSATGVSTSAAASSPEVGFPFAFFINVPGQVLMTFSKVNTFSMQPDEGAHLSRSCALKGAAAEVAKASFKAHRAEVAENTEPSPTSPAPKTTPSSFAIIEDIRSALTKLSAGFSLPPSLDFSDDEPDGLAHTPTNAPVRVYEHALNKLLEQLDAVESDGDEEVRVVRRAAVKEVEKTIEDVEKRVKEARERARSCGSPESEVFAEADPTEGKNVNGAVHEDPSVNNDEPETKELLLNSGDRVDSAPLGLENLPIPSPEVATPDVAKPTGPKLMQDDDILKDQPSTPVSGSAAVPIPVPVVSPSVAPTEHIEAIVSTDDVSESEHDLEVDVEQATTAPSEPEILITPQDSSAEVSVPTLGAIAPSSTPIAPLVPSTIPDELPASLSRDRFFVSLGDGDAEADDTDGEGDWTEI
jgi:BAG domain